MDSELTPEVVQETKERLAAVVPAIPILRDGEFCESESFLDDLAPIVLKIIVKVATSERSPYQAAAASQKCEAELLYSIRHNSTIGLNSSIAYGAVSVKYVWVDDPNRGIIISMFARALRRRWQISKEEKHLDDAIYYFQKTVEVEPEEEENRALHFDDLACALHQRYLLHQKDADFDETKAAYAEALAIPHSSEPAFHSQLGNLFKDKASFVSDAAEKKALLEESYATQLKAISSVTPEFRGSMHFIYSNLAGTYLQLYGVDSDDFAGNIQETLQQLIRPTGKMWIFLYEFGVILGNKYLDKNQQADALQSISFLRAALEESPDNQMVKSALGDILQRYGMVIKSKDLLDEAYPLNEAAIASLGPFDPSLLDKLQWTSLALATRFELTLNPDDIDKAISLSERGLSFPSLKENRRWKFRQIQGVHFGYKFQATEDASYLGKGISSFKAALDYPELLPSDKGDTLREYGKVLFQSYKVLKKDEDMEEALKSFRAAIDIWGRNNQNSIPAFNDLASASTVRFERTGKSEHIQQSIDDFLHGLALVEKASSAYQYMKPMFYLGLGNAFYAKHEVWDQAADLNQSIFYYQGAVDNSTKAEYRLPGRVGGLSRALMQKFRITAEKRFLEQGQSALNAILTDPNIALSPADVAFLYNIQGTAYMHFFDNSDKDISFLDLAAESFRTAAESGCKQPVFANPPIVNYTRALIARYQITKDVSDLQRFVTELPKLRNLVGRPDGRVTRGLTDTMGHLAQVVYDVHKMKPFGMMAIELYGMLAKDESAFPERRIRASLEAARMVYEIMGQPAAGQARDILKSVIELLPNAILMGPNRGDQLRAAKELSSLPSLILSFSIAANDSLGDAVRLFEQSRSVIWNRLLDSRTDLTNLQQQHEELAIKFEHARGRLSRTRPSAVVTESSALVQLQQHQIALEYNEIVRLIREQEGFQNFLLLEESSRLTEHASQGPIVIFNVTAYRSDAVVISSDSITSIPLPQFTSAKCYEHAGIFLYALSIIASEFGEASSQMTQVLKWLWEAAAKPVLDHLGFSGSDESKQRLPRIWWMASSWLYLFPMHAAGDHALALETGEPCTVIDRSISSYVSSLRVLDFIRKSAADRSSPQLTSALLVKMPTTPGDQDLPNVEKEVEEVEFMLKSSFTVTSLDRPKRRDVLPLLERSSMAHFACHGVANDQDPSLSKLKLQDWKTNPLDVRAILKVPFKRLNLVYLSACETAANRGAKLQEESIHISAAFQVVGVPHVIASLWNIEDNISGVIAADFYGFLKGNDVSFDFGKSAEALHSAVLKARRGGADALLWGAFVHFGL